MPRPIENGQNPSKYAELNGKLNGGEPLSGNGNEEKDVAQRPPAIEEDLWEMGRRKRVKEVLGAEDFRTELEQIVRPDFAKSFPEGLNCAIHHHQGVIPSFGRLFPVGHLLPSLPPLNVNQVLQNVPIPIADLPSRINHQHQYSLEERHCRNKLATFYRLVDLFQWSQGIYNHITLRLPGPEPPQILINPFGLLYHEITSSSLIKLTLNGEVLDQGSTNLGVNQAAYVLHSAIHEARSDVQCVLHLHTAVVAAVGSMKCGLLPICQEAMIIGPVAYHDYQGILTDDEEKKSIVTDLGDKNVMILRNHGFVVCGQTVEDALHLAFHTIIACETQIRAARAGIENLIIPSEEAVQKAYKTARRGGGGVNRTTGENMNNSIGWGIGELEWEAWCRTLDTAGFCTGHIYRNAHFRPQPLPNSHHSMYNLGSVATPPSGPSSIGAVDESEGAAAWRLSMLRKERERAKWLNSPCQYQKVQLMETGTANPRMVTKWVEQNGCASASSGGTPVKIDSPHQFSPSNGPDKQREFRERKKRLKEIRMSGTISPGPKSQVLEGITLEEAMEKEEMTNNRPVYIGTASKGIIQRDKQMNAQVYRQLYAPNPFRRESEQNLKEYLEEVGEKGANSRNNNNNRVMPTLAMNGVAIAPQSLPGSPIGAMPESPTMDTASLMQAVKRVKLNGRSASGDAENDVEVGNKGNGIANGKKNGTKEVVVANGEKKQQKRRRGIFFFGRKKSS